MTTHALSPYVDGKGRLRGLCGAVVDREAPDRLTDCMTCLVHEARRSADANGAIIGRVVSVNPDGTVTIDLETTGSRPWR